MQKAVKQQMYECNEYKAVKQNEVGTQVQEMSILNFGDKKKKVIVILS